MGYKSSLDIVVQATLTQLDECIREFHGTRGSERYVWDAVASIGKTLDTRLEIRNDPNSSSRDQPIPTDYQWTWTIAAVDVMSPGQAVFCYITADSMPGWINAFGDVLNLNFWPDWTTEESRGDSAYVKSYQRYISLLLEELRCHGMIQQFPTWLSATESRLELFVDDLDSFNEVKAIAPQAVGSLVPLDLSEDQIQTFLEAIIGENFHQQDWGGEQNDLVTTHIKVAGRRIRAAFLLKGNGTKGNLTLAKCGKNGDQIARLVEAPADLYVVQHVDRIDPRVVTDLAGKVQLRVSRGDRCQMCTMDGTDTARVLKAYGKI